MHVASPSSWTSLLRAILETRRVVAVAAAWHEWKLPPTHGSPLAIPEASLGATYNVGRQDAKRTCQEITCTPHTSRTSAVGHVATKAVPCHLSAPGQSIPKLFAAYPIWLPLGHPRGPARQLRAPTTSTIRNTNPTPPLRARPKSRSTIDSVVLQQQPVGSFAARGGYAAATSSWRCACIFRLVRTGLPSVLYTGPREVSCKLTK